MSLHARSLAAYMKPIDADDWRADGELMLSSATKLASIGADFVICPDNTIHQAPPFIADRLPVPWLHIAEVMAEECVERGFRKLGLTGTRHLVESDVYPDALSARGVEFVRPNAG
ncbi:MAG TPA: aspartate/glutamate racemase family protein [Thermoanaerobaculia bacterium]|nr:aspartate/glutamate racemase family protein [Thermoanaerobaculia bacterium]